MIKYILITGAAQRLGAAMARHFHHQGYSVFLHYHRSQTEAAALANELLTQRANSCFLLQADLTDTASYQEITQHIQQHTDKLDILINNASTFYPTPLASASIEDWQKIIGSNLQAPFFLSQALNPLLQASQGCIINIGDIHGIRPLPDHILYSVAKAGLHSLTQALAQALAPKVRVNAVAPGAILWHQGTADPLSQKKIVGKTALKRQAQISELIATIDFLCHQGHYITGQILPVDGGRTLHQ